jgi:hypothetical protein
MDFDDTLHPVEAKAQTRAMDDAAVGRLRGALMRGSSLLDGDEDEPPARAWRAGARGL